MLAERRIGRKGKGQAEVIAILIKTDRHTGVPDISGVATDPDAVTEFLEGAGKQNTSVRVELWRKDPKNTRQRCRRC
jgi:hypothetical protein